MCLVFMGKLHLGIEQQESQYLPDQALERLRDQAKTLIRKARETAAQEDSGLVAHATTV